MKKLFSILLLMGIPIFGSEKLKEIEGVKITKGYIATYDKLEDTTTVQQKSSQDISIRIRKIKTDNYFMIFDLSHSTMSKLFITNSILYIKNGNDPIQKFELIWDNPKRDVFRTGGYSLYTEYHSFINEDLEKFIINNLKSNSEVTIRFQGEQYSDEQISKKQLKLLLNIIEFYNSLIQQQATK